MAKILDYIIAVCPQKDLFGSSDIGTPRRVCNPTAL